MTPVDLGAQVAELLGADAPEFVQRLGLWWPDLAEGLTEAYGAAGESAARRAVLAAARAWAARSGALRALDTRRLAEPDWFQRPSMLGYACYAERFGGDLAGVGQRVDYLTELGVTYLHLMPLLRPRPGADDGGYAVMDYRSVRPDLGTVEDLRSLADVLRGKGISLVLDLVLNHVAAEHEWAVRARAGEHRYRDYFHVFADRQQPDAFEQSLPEVFPDFAPGSFTWDADLDGWVWTTFNAWQWDLNWHNPEVFLEFADLLLFLAGVGVEVLRLDAIAFLWKRLGTSCQNQPEVHALTRALRAVARLAAPALLFKAEAIVGPDDLPAYLGTGAHSGKVSDLAYQNSLMVQVWSSLATKDARLATVALRRFPRTPETTAWATYVRGHDDIGWAIDDADASAVGWDGNAHRAFLSDFYSGTFPGSDARGLVFQSNPSTGDRRISGTCASLVGLEAALASGDRTWILAATRRHVLAQLVILGFGGIPVLWSGDELALRNDPDWAAEPGHEQDNRWVHRPRLPWSVAALRSVSGSLEQQVFSTIRQAARTRATLPALHASAHTELLDPVLPGVLAWLRVVAGQRLVALHELTGAEQEWPASALPMTGPVVDALSGERMAGDVPLAPYACRWLVAGS